MTRTRIFPFVPILACTLALAACVSPEDMQGSNRDVARRMQARLAPDISAGQATLYAAPDRTSVIIPERALFGPSAPGLDENGQLILARVMQGLLAPEITRVDISGPPAASWTLQAERVQAVRNFFVHYGLGSTLQPAGAQAPLPPASPDSITIAVRVVWS